ncbi:MAG: transposase [Prevotellaceae bacterium]|nr:transposase [Prevotellaceae bacterium]
MIWEYHNNIYSTQKIENANRDGLFIAQNMSYNEGKDYFVCPTGQHMIKVGTGIRKSESSHVSNTSFYKAQSSTSCPLKCLCSKAQENRRIEINHKLNAYRKNARDQLISEEGLLHRTTKNRKFTCQFSFLSKKIALSKDFLFNSPPDKKKKPPFLDRFFVFIVIAMSETKAKSLVGARFYLQKKQRECKKY